MNMRLKRLWRYMLYALGGLGILIVIVNGAVYATARGYVYENAANSPTAQAAIIPGAAVSAGGKLSPIFEDRVQAAIELYTEGKVKKILVSGDNSTTFYNEVNPVRNYLLERGIPDEDIFLDHAGFDTYSTMYRARDIFGVESAIITSQGFHLPRAVAIGRLLGMEVYGLRADRRPVRLKNYLREALANEKAALDLLLRRTPKFLGDPIPITGDGRMYP